MPVRSSADFWRKNQTGQFLSPTEKANIAANREIVTIVGIDTTTGRFGVQWLLTVLYQDNERQMTFGAGPWRDEQIEDIRTVIELNGDLRSTLVAFQTSTGQTGYNFAPPPDEQLALDAESVNQLDDVPF